MTDQTTPSAAALDHEQERLVAAFRAMSNEKRLLVLDWLRQPRSHFREQVDGDLVDDGVCGLLLAEKLGITQPTLSEHMRILVQSELVRAKRIKQWTFYKRDEEAVDRLVESIRRRI